MRHEDVWVYLKQIQQENGKLSLENIQRLVDQISFPASSLRCIQIAGTNGKGSTSAFLSSILQQAGYRVGLFTSPHLQDVRERIQLNGRHISVQDFVTGVRWLRDLAKSMLSRRRIDNLPTFFETIFLVALRHFLEHKADWAVLEVGLGGRLDATSTIKPLLAVITNISRDHTNILGKTLSAIAYEKAGIIKAEVPLVCGCPRASVAGKVIHSAAVVKKAPYFEVFGKENSLQLTESAAGYNCRYQTINDSYDFEVRLRGKHQARNAAVAVKASEVLHGQGFTIPREAISRGIPRTFIPARIEYFPGQPPIILDGGHNEAGIRVLTEYLAEKEIKKATWIFGVLRDKAYAKMARRIAPWVGEIVLTNPPSSRFLPAEKLVRFLPGITYHIEKNFSRALTIAKKRKKIIIISGSLYLAGALRTILLGGRKRGYK